MAQEMVHNIIRGLAGDTRMVASVGKFDNAVIEIIKGPQQQQQQRQYYGQQQPQPVPASTFTIQVLRGGVRICAGGDEEPVFIFDSPDLAHDLTIYMLQYDLNATISVNLKPVLSWADTIRVKVGNTDRKDQRSVDEIQLKRCFPGGLSDIDDIDGIDGIDEDGESGGGSSNGGSSGGGGKKSRSHSGSSGAGRGDSSCDKRITIALAIARAYNEKAHVMYQRLNQPAE